MRVRTGHSGPALIHVVLFRRGVGVVLRRAGECCAIQPPGPVHPGALGISRGGRGGLDRAVRRSYHELGPTGRLPFRSCGGTSGDLETPAVGIGEAAQQGCCGLDRDRCSSRAPDPSRLRLPEWPLDGPCPRYTRRSSGWRRRVSSRPCRPPRGIAPERPRGCLISLWTWRPAPRRCHAMESPISGSRGGDADLPRYVRRGPIDGLEQHEDRCLT